MVDELEPESGSEPDAGGGAISPAAALAVGLRKGRARDTADPELNTFLNEQTRLVRLQTEHLHEQRELVLSRLRWGRFSDRMRALLQIMTAMVGAVVVALVATMAWQAHEAHGLVIEAFSVPPDLARTGLTGQVAASRFLDKLQELQTLTTSARPSQSYATDWGSDFKVEIPETGLTFSEFDKLLRERLGHVDHVTGEVVSVPEGIAVTARMGDEPPQTFTGPLASFDDLARKAAEAVYRTSQPYRYAEYLDNANRSAEAFQVIADLAENGPPSERGWAYGQWALMDVIDHGDVASARRHAALGRSRGGGADVQDGIARVNNEVMTSHEEADLAASRELAILAQKRQPDTSAFFMKENRLLAQAWLTFVEPDYAASAGWWERTLLQDPQSSYIKVIPAMAATAYALGHDLPSAHRAMAQVTVSTDGELALSAAEGAFLALPRFWIPAETGDWTQALADVRNFDAALEAGKAQRPVYVLMQQTWIWPLEALALAHTGDNDAAEALIGKTPLDCYLCVRARGRIAAQRRDWAEADRWFAEAVRQAPSLPQAHAEWARARLARGDAQGAISQAGMAQAKNPHFADAPEIWGEALIARRDFTGAASRFAQADRLAPRWGRNHLMWGQALMLSGRYAAARAQFQTANALDLSRPDRAALNVLLARTASGPLHG
jgi:tetratricopeptide (TPR) repeat protein